MDKTEAKAVLSGVLEHFRGKPYEALASLVDSGFVKKSTHYQEITTDQGKWYQIQVNVYWDDKAKGTLRVVGAIDDGGWRAFMPLTEAFLVERTGACQ